jgi:4-diphosphocytidyl-2-C-methyl-D-erythritol kinase
MRGQAFAKINLGLRVGEPREDGYHPLVSLAQSIDWTDTMSLDLADEDGFDVTGADLPAGSDNLAWRAVEAVRDGWVPSLHLTLDKDIAEAAGLGGGSADAALGLVLATTVLRGDPAAAVAMAPRIGADVPFCLSGGTAWMEGIGERITRIATPDDHWYALVVPPFELPTPAVYGRWDELGGPTGPEVDGRDLPVSLRDHGPLRNDLQPAAVSLQPALGDWIADLGSRWSQPVLMSGSGPTLFGFFATEAEARDAIGAAPDARATRAARPVGVGWRLDDAPGVPAAPWL